MLCSRTLSAVVWPVDAGVLGEDSYVIEGIGSSEVSDIFDPDVIDEAITIEDRMSFEVSAELIKQHGFGGFVVGTTVATTQLAAHEDIIPIVALLPDGWDRYWSKALSADWMSQLQMKPLR